MDFIVWMDYTSPEPEKSFGLLDEESSCYIELPAEWEGNLMLTDLSLIHILTTWELDKLIYDFIVKHGGTPNFKGLYGFPGTACILSLIHI